MSCGPNKVCVLSVLRQDEGAVLVLPRPHQGHRVALCDAALPEIICVQHGTPRPSWSHQASAAAPLLLKLEGADAVTEERDGLYRTLLRVQGKK